MIDIICTGQSEDPAYANDERQAEKEPLKARHLVETGVREPEQAPTKGLNTAFSDAIQIAHSSLHKFWCKTLSYIAGP